MTLRKLLTIGLASAPLLGGCHLKDKNGNDGDPSTEASAVYYRNAIPRGETVTVRVPGANASGQALTETQAQAITAAPGQTADLYKLTWAASSIFNGGALLVLGLVKTVVSFPPTTLTADTAVWGPWVGGPLEPITWKVTVTRKGDHLYSYKFEGRDKLAPTAPFVTVLSGDHTPALDPSGRPIEGFGSGSFTLDNDARQMLPVPGKDVGKAHYTYERATLAATVSIDAQFIQVKDDERPGQLVDLGYRYRSTPGSGGTMEFLHSAPAGMTMAGTIWKVKSRWLETGAGRSDVEGVGGDLPAGYKATVNECWSAAFASTYQRFGWDPALGWGVEATDCVFTSAEYSTL